MRGSNLRTRSRYLISKFRLFSFLVAHQYAMNKTPRPKQMCDSDEERESDPRPYQDTDGNMSSIRPWSKYDVKGNQYAHDQIHQTELHQRLAEEGGSAA